MINRGCLISLFFLCLLTSCKNPSLTYAYLMQHPKLIQKEMMHCQLTLVENTECAEIKRAANDFDQLVLERQNNPEQFGEQILRAEEQLADESHSESDVEHMKILLAVVAATSME